MALKAYISLKHTRLLSIILVSVMCLTIQASANGTSYHVSDQTYDRYLEVSRISNTRQGMELADSLSKEAEKINDFAAQCLYLSLVLNYYGHNNDSTGLVTTADRMRRQANMGGADTEPWFFWASHQQALHMINHNHFFEATEIASNIHDEAKRRNSHWGVFSTLLLIGDIYRQRNDMGLAGENFIKAYEYQQQYLPDVNIGQLCAYLGEYYRRKSGRTAEDLQKSKEFIDKGLAEAENNSVRAKLLVEKAMMLYSERKIPEFYRIYNQCDSLYGANTSNPDFLQIKYRKYILDGNYKKAIEIADRLTNDYDRQIARYVIERSRGNYEAALKNYEQATHSLNVIREHERRGDLSEISARLGNYELEQANTQLEHERTEALGARAHAINFAFCLILVMVLLVLGALVINNRRTKRTNRQLAKNNEALDAALKKAEESERMKTVFIQNMSHEIRTPLNAIVGFSTLLTYPEQEFSNAELDQFRELINSNCDVLTSLVDDILTISDLESGKYQFEYHPTSINHICLNAIESMMPRAKNGVKMTFTSQFDDDYTVMTDSLRLSQVISNLLINACKYTEVGEINLSVKGTYDNWLRIVVTDTGPGVPAEMHNSIFERFIKLDRYKSGTGLGLNICRMIAEKFNGRVYLDTTYTGGARFVFEMPVK